MAFDKGSYRALLETIGTKIGELHAIDVVTDYLNGLNEGGPVNPDPYGTSGPPEGDNVQYGFVYEVHLAERTDQSFVYGVSLGQPYAEHRDAIAAQIQRIKETAYAQGDSVVDQVLGITPHVADPDAEQFTAIASDLDKLVTTTLNNLADDDFATLKSSLADWQGQARQNFQDYFYEPYDRCLTTQAWVSTSIAHLLALSAAIVRSGQHSLMNLARATDEHLDAQLKSWHDAHTPDPAAHGALIFGATALSLLALVPLPAVNIPANLGRAAVAVALDNVPKSVSHQVQVKRVRGLDILHETVEQAREAVAKVDEAWDTFADEAVGSPAGDRGGAAEGSVNAGLAMAMDLDRWVVRRPDLADGGIAPGDFNHESSGREDT